MGGEDGGAVEFQGSDVACHWSVVGIDEVLACYTCLTSIDWKATEAVSVSTDLDITRGFEGRIRHTTASIRRDC